MKDFMWLCIDEQNYGALNKIEKEQTLINWALSARGRNPDVFDEVTAWILDDGQWNDEKLEENKKIIMERVIGRFKAQNALLRNYLEELKPLSIINEAVFGRLDRFDEELSGRTADKRLQEMICKIFEDFSIMKSRSAREQFAGNETGAYGTDSVELFGYINYLKDCDAGVQWAIFMPQVVQNQQNGFKVVGFEYKKLPAFRFIGKQCVEHDEKDMSYEIEIMQALDALDEYKTELQFDVLFQHHYGKGVDVEPWRGFWGRFMRADTPVPEGFVHFDFIPAREANNFVAGPPYLSQFAYAQFEGDVDAIHGTEGFDSDAMYDVTRNIILGQGINIPYPDKYWTAEVFLKGVQNPSSAYMFSVEL